MIITYIHRIGWFIGLVLLQVLILNNVHIAGYATPFLYIYFILKFDSGTSRNELMLWAFFFGLVLASTWFVGKDIKEWNKKTIPAFIIGVAVAYYITVATPAETPSNLFFIFLCGAIAICAMILPGISGSFILVLLGKYFYIMEAVKTFDIVTLLVFLAGACIGITTFSRVLSYALKNFRNITLAVLTGFMLGSLNKVWPWKETLETFTDSHGVVKPLVEANILPNQYIVEAVVLMIVGFFLVYFLEKLSTRSAK